MLHGPVHTSEECKVLNIYSGEYAAQGPRENKEARSGGNPKRGKTVEFDENTQEVNVVDNHDNPIPRNKKDKNWLSKSAKLKA